MWGLLDSVIVVVWVGIFAVVLYAIASFYAR